MYNLYNEDCLEYIKKINNNSIDLIVTAPPYKTTQRGANNGKFYSKGFKECKVELEEYFSDMYRVLKDGSHCYIFCNNLNLRKMLNIANDVGFKFVKCLIWDKGNKIAGQSYMNQFEYILFLRKGKHRKINNCSTSDILKFPNKKEKNENGELFHEVQQPVDLIKLLIENSSKEGDIVLDLFMGGGTTGVACIRSCRNFIGIEIEKKYFKTAKNRIEKECINKCLNKFMR